MRPAQKTYPDYYDLYIPLVKEDSVVNALHANLDDIKKFFSGIEASKENYAYQPGKWTVKQVAHHLCDTERIIAYRALRFARKDPQQPLPFEEDQYAATAELGNRDL